jgi:hypothetical protein
MNTEKTIINKLVHGLTRRIDVLGLELDYLAGNIIQQEYENRLSEILQERPKCEDIQKLIEEIKVLASLTDYDFSSFLLSEIFNCKLEDIFEAMKFLKSEVTK